MVSSSRPVASRCSCTVTSSALAVHAQRSSTASLRLREANGPDLDQDNGKIMVNAAELAWTFDVRGGSLSGSLIRPSRASAAAAQPALQKASEGANSLHRYSTYCWHLRFDIGICLALMTWNWGKALR